MKCPLCGALVKSDIFTASISYHGTDYKLFPCSGCKNGYWWPLEMPSGNWYAQAENGQTLDIQDYYSGLHSPNASLTPAQLYFLKKISTQNGVLIDIGCGNGSFVKKASENLQVYGIDFDHKSVEAAKKLGLKNVSCSSLEDFIQNGDSTRKFDFVCLFEVLEHQSNPVLFLSNIKKILKSEGIIAGSVPAHNVIRPIAQGDTPPNHFLAFTKIGLENFLRAEGFDSIEVKELFDEQAMRVTLGANSSTLRSIFRIKEGDADNHSVKIRAYKMARFLGKMVLPILNGIGGMVLGITKKEAIKKIKEEDKVYYALYFQAKYS
jgi:2-polyprenyl-3-methyl-5-hydroxy-6-metoxy-1,4-benzoquinol methylase